MVWSCSVLATDQDFRASQTLTLLHSCSFQQAAVLHHFLTPSATQTQWFRGKPSRTPVAELERSRYHKAAALWFSKLGLQSPAIHEHLP